MTLMEVSIKYGDNNNNNGTDKGICHSYLETYDKLLTPFIGKEISILEVGVLTGKSLLMWEEFLQNAKIHGIDVSNRPAILDGHPSIVFHRANSTHKNEVDAELGEMQFNVVIDDGSHDIRDQLATARLLLPRVKAGGIYVVEDVNTGDPSRAGEMFGEIGKCEVVDLRTVKNRYDDVLIIFRKDQESVV
jgi:cephalosporin hydroxylase